MHDSPQPTRPTRVAAARAVTVLAAAALLGPSVAGANAPASCDARAGTTLAANTVVRLYTAKVGHRLGLYVCRYRGNRAVLLDRILRHGREFAPYGVNGSRVFWVQQMSKKQRTIDPTTRALEVSVWNADDPKHLSSTGSITFVWQSAVINAAGRVAAIADPDGRSAGTNSEVQVYDPAGVGGIQAVASAPAGTISDLGASSNTLIWHQPDGLHTAPFALPTTPAAGTP